MLKIKHLFLLGVLLITQLSTVHAQVNFKVGYSLAYSSPSELNQLISDFNILNQESIDIEMPDMGFLSGIEIGVRYRLSNTIFEFSYENFNTSKEALGEDPSGNLFKERIFYGQYGLNLAIETRFQRVGWGMGIGRRTQSIRTNIASSDEKRSIINNKGYALKAYTIIDFGGTNNLAFELRPFVIYPLSKTNLSPLADEWSLNAQGIGEDRFFTFGLSFSFYNGPQP